MMFFLFVCGASAWTVGAPSATVQYASPAVEYAQPAGFLAANAGVPTMIFDSGVPVYELPYEAPQPAGNTGALVALCGLGALAGYGLGRNQAALSVTGKPAAVRPRAGPVYMAKSRSLPWQECPAHLEGMIGNAGFDPLGLSTPKNIKWMREAEIEHGRLCMLAWAGYVAVDLGIKFPGAKYAALSSFEAHDVTARYELAIALLFVGTAETIKVQQIFGMMQGTVDRQPGDFGFDPLKLVTPENEERYKTAELTHGRAAMLAFSGVVTQSALGHAAFPYVN
jgi:hypothetical protein